MNSIGTTIRTTRLNRRFCLLISIVVLISTCWAQTVTERPRMTTLFDGKRMIHWDLNYEDGWSIEEGALVPSSEHRKNNYLWTKRSYGDFMLALQYRLSEGANSGVFYRSDPSNPVQGGFEIQLLDGGGKDDEQGRPTPKSNGALYDSVAPSKYNNAPTGEWNALMIFARGPKVSVFVNGDLMASADFDRWTTPGENPDGSKNKFKTALAELPRIGKIGLQYHGQPVAFRHIRITEVTDATPDPTVVTPRPLGNHQDKAYWLRNMIVAHRYMDGEIALATGLDLPTIRAVKSELGFLESSGAAFGDVDALRVLPFPGGRHTRIGFLDGAIDPNRETKLSVFLPWDSSAYVVADFPEAIHSNLGLAYLAHKHVPTIWSAKGIGMEPLEWKRNDDGTFELLRELPNGIAYEAEAKLGKDSLHMRLSLTNGTDAELTGLRVQNCIMLRGAPEFARLTMDNRFSKSPYAAVHNREGDRWMISAWEPHHRVWGNDRCPCVHSDPKFPDCSPGETVSVVGVLSFHEGRDVETAIARLANSDWQGAFAR